MKTVIAAVTHREYDIPEDTLYMPIMAGTALLPDDIEVPEGYQRDDAGDNISAANRNYCELTGLYWLWKNYADAAKADNIGICHYRRYFASKDGKEMLGSAEANSMMTRYSVVLPAARNYVIETNYSHYAHAHHAEDLDKTREIISEKYPSYLLSFDAVMDRRSGHRFNMFIMRRDLMCKYCSWLFDILFELEERLDISEYSDRDKRVFGYVGERLLDVWLDANELEYAELPYIMTERENLPLKAARMILRKISAAGGSLIKWRL